MSDVPVARNKHTSYENFVAECPWCSKESIFNRASDLGTFEPIAGRDVSCQSADCGKPFRIVGDAINSPHEMLIFDCYELVERKHYMNCILSLAQAYEVFFSLFFRVELLYKPFGADPEQEPADLNRLSEELHEKIKEHTFTGMRALFLEHMVTGRSPKNLAEAAAMVAALPDRPREPRDAAIESLGDAKLVPLLRAVKTTSINTLRNRVVHKQAYRPTREEVEEAIKETQSVLFPLTRHLNLYDEINWYMKKT
ncbi:MAG TPA: hypothetical protein VNL14_00635 [Candidatus Acidoferrales bacterium]|nr:hypothetical protein [Candidatus Acidoferrales bacterium]